MRNKRQTKLQKQIEVLLSALGDKEEMEQFMQLFGLRSFEIVEQLIAIHITQKELDEFYKLVDKAREIRDGK